MATNRSRSKSSKSSASRSKSSAKSRAGAKGGAKTAQRRGAQGTSSRARGAAKAPRNTRSAARTTGGTSRSRTPVAQAIDILMNDHKKVQGMFRQAERAKKDKEKLRGIVEEACEALTLHSEIEEQHFYPVLRQALKETDLIAEAEVEHTSAKQLIAELESGDPEEEQYAATFTVLGEYVKHHIKEEEGEIFPKARRARGDFEPLLQALQQRDAAEQGEGAAAEGAARSAPSSRRAGRRAEAGEEEGAAEGGARGRQGRGRRSSRGRGSEARTEGAEAGAEAGAEGDIEQPRRSRRGEAAETGETETAIHGHDQEPVDEGTRGSRR